LAPREPNAVCVRARVSVTEITGSESFVHLDFAGHRWVMLEEGIHRLEVGETVDVFIDTRHMLVFDKANRRVTTGNSRAA
ncbi:TOBE domain-containing protein, partial [Pantoea sp. SIMBA_133]